VKKTGKERSSEMKGNKSQRRQEKKNVKRCNQHISKRKEKKRETLSVVRNPQKLCFC
jgi:hypothetical protein